jgi:hypothetical protein
MANQQVTLRQIVHYLNNPDQNGGFWLPHIQRAFVWSEEQICRLFDSIMREYPISTLLIWKTKSPIQRRQFIAAFKTEYRDMLAPFFVPSDEKTKCLVLDGQQRLQSLFIGLKGSYEGKELFFDVTSGDHAATDEIKYRFKFLASEAASFPWVRFKALVLSDHDPVTLYHQVLAMAGEGISEAQKSRIGPNIGRVFQTFCAGNGLGYQEVDSVDHPTLYSEEDVVEIFIRANSGGTTLGKADLLFSLLAAGWEKANEEIEGLLASSKHHGFDLTRDFVLKTCLTLLQQGASYEVVKFRRPGVREEIERNWQEIRDTIDEVLDFVRSKAFIQCDRALPSYNILIPIMYLRYRYKAAWNQASGIPDYLLRASLAGSFGIRPDRLIDVLVAAIDAKQGFSLDDVYQAIRTYSRLLVPEDRLWEMGYGSQNVHLLFNLWYAGGFNYTPAYSKNLPQVDHIFPQSELRKLRVTNPETGRAVLKHREPERNHLANCMLLTAEENGFAGKTNTLPDKWFDPDEILRRNEHFGPAVPKTPEKYYDLHLIPRDPALWKMERYDDFIAERKKLILERFAHLLVPASTTSSGPVAN